MTKRKDFEEVKKTFEDSGYELLETKYINGSTKMKYICPKHLDKDTRISFRNLKSGHGCPYCSNNGKNTLSEVKEEFKDRGYELLEEHYVNSKTKMKYKCKKHPNEDMSISFNSFKKGHGCPCCGGSAKLTLRDAKTEFKKFGYRLLETEYINSRFKMKYECPNHPEKHTSIGLNDLKSGHGCPYCSGGIKLSLEEVKKEFKKQGYYLLDTEYISVSTKMKYRCSHHPDKNISIRLQDLKKGHGCRYCANEKMTEMTGEKGRGWKGGITSLSGTLRTSTKRWIQQSLEKSNYKCALTKKNHPDLQIHHTKSFHTIRDEVLESLGLDRQGLRNNYNEKEIKLIVSGLEEKHDEILGIPLRKDIHGLFHKLYGRKNNTEEQFNEFKQRWESGEFNSLEELVCIG